jgi:microcystin-dependent protein
MEGVIGYVTGFAGNFAPKNWAFCQGQTINIAANTALFSILGTTYGGNGTTTFQLPDLQGRAIVGAGTGPGLSTYALGEKTGTLGTTLTGSQMPVHVHPVAMQITQGASESGSNPTPANGVFASPSNGSPLYASSPTTTMQAYQGTITMANAGSSLPVSALNYIVCQSGVFPARN